MTPADLQVAHQFVDLPGLRMHFVSAGAGPLVILLHGFPEGWWSWRYQVKPLVDAGFRVIAPDLRGYGATEKQGPYDLDTIVADVCHLIESQGGPRAVRIVGHDWGGATAWHLAATRPAFCERLAVINCPHPEVLREVMIGQRSLKQLKKSWYMFFFMLPGLPEYALTRNDAAAVIRMLRGASRDRSHFSPEEVRPFRDDIQRPGAARAMVGWYREAMRSGLRGAPKRAPQITVKSLLIWGMEDPALGFDELVPGTLERVPQLQLQRIANAGHFVHAEAPSAVNPLLLAFLA